VRVAVRPEFHLDSLPRSSYIFTAFSQKKRFLVSKGGFVSGLRINISKLSEGVHDRSLEIEPGDLGLDDRFNETVRIQATLEKSTKQLYLTVELSTGGRFVCDRCLDEHRRDVKTKYSIVYMFGSEESLKADNQEVVFIHPDTSFVEIDEDVRQFAILAIP